MKLTADAKPPSSEPPPCRTAVAGNRQRRCRARSKPVDVPRRRTCRWRAERRGERGPRLIDLARPSVSGIDLGYSCDRRRVGYEGSVALDDDVVLVGRQAD